MQWINVKDAVPDNRRPVLAWGTTTYSFFNKKRTGFLGKTKFNPSKTGGNFDIENGSLFSPVFVNVTHWAEITPPNDLYQQD